MNSKMILPPGVQIAWGLILPWLGNIVPGIWRSPWQVWGAPLPARGWSWTKPR